MLCPHDQSVLQSHGEQATLACFCEICHGVWFGREQLLHFLKNGTSAKALPRRKVFTGKIQRSASQCLCPSCKNQELSVKIIDGVEIDLCNRCQGIWLDAGELDLILTRYRRKQRLDGFSDSAAEFLGHAAPDPGVLAELTNLISNALGKSSEWASEAAPALLDFIGEAFSAIDF